MTLREGSEGPQVRDLQKALNERLRKRGRPRIPVDGKYGPETEKAKQEVVRLLGFPAQDLDRPGATARVRRLIADPSQRPKSYLATARKRRAEEPKPLGFHTGGQVTSTSGGSLVWTPSTSTHSDARLQVAAPVTHESAPPEPPVEKRPGFWRWLIDSFRRQH